MKNRLRSYVPALPAFRGVRPAFGPLGYPATWDGAHAVEFVQSELSVLFWKP